MYISTTRAVCTNDDHNLSCLEVFDFSENIMMKASLLNIDGNISVATLRTKLYHVEQQSARCKVHTTSYLTKKRTLSRGP